MNMHRNCHYCHGKLQYEDEDGEVQTCGEWELEQQNA